MASSTTTEAYAHRIELLEKPERFPQWKKAISNHLVIKGLSSVLDFQPAMPPPGTTAATRDDLKEKRLRAYAEISNACGTVADAKLSSCKEAGNSVTQAVEALEQHFKGNKMAYYDAIMNKLETLTIHTHNDDPSELGQEFKKLWDDLKHLDPQADPGEPYLIRRYLRALGTEYELEKMGRNGLYGQGYMKYARTLERWRGEGGLRGIEVR